MAEKDKKSRREKSQKDTQEKNETLQAPDEIVEGRPEGYVPRLYALYLEKLSGELMKKFELKNRMQVPKLTKIVINIGCGEGAKDIKVLDAAAKELGQITGQRPVITRAKKSIANFKIREGMPIGCMVTLRGTNMYEFLDRLINLAFPRIKDFRGISAKSFDGAGNFTFGLKEQMIFPEINVDALVRPTGMNITLCISGNSDEMSRELLKGLGFPFSS
jgi:large subunit ribosomal protein L5